MNSSLVTKKCTPFEGGVPPLTEEQIQPFLKQINSAWEVIDGKKVRREFAFNDFQETMTFVAGVAELAETENHHPDMHVSYNKVVIELWTHKINGLFDNDFILAAKIDQLYDKQAS
jgi:4a-hydroxytetrahydrobiopterin dehydratase